MSETVNQILAAHKQRLQQQEKEPDSSGNSGKYFSTLKAEGLTTDFLEFRFKNGAAFFAAYSELEFFNYNPSGTIDMICGGFTVEIVGRNLRPLLDAIKSKRVGWIREADTEMEDGEDNTTFVANIWVEYPSGSEEEETQPEM